MSSAAQPIGRGILDTDLALSQIGDVDAMHEMLAMLHESLQRDIPDIATMLHKGDGVGANRLLHALKGFIPIFCQAALCEEVMRVEAISKDLGNPELPAAYAALRPRLEQLLAEVASALQGRASPV